MAKLPIFKDRWWRILGVSFVMYVLSYIDRTNIAMAIPAMPAELHMSAVAVGQATSVFFWGYIILQAPGGTRRRSRPLAGGALQPAGGSAGAL